MKKEKENKVSIAGSAEGKERWLTATIAT